MFFNKKALCAKRKNGMVRFLCIHITPYRVRTEGISVEIVIYLIKHSDKGLILLYYLF